MSEGSVDTEELEPERKTTKLSPLTLSRRASPQTPPSANRAHANSVNNPPLKPRSPLSPSDIQHDVESLPDNVERGIASVVISCAECCSRACDRQGCPTCASWCRSRVVVRSVTLAVTLMVAALVAGLLWLWKQD